MNKVWKKAAAVALAGVMSAGMLTGCGAKTKKLDGTKVVATVEGEDIQLGLLSFVVRNQQAYLKAMYEAYGMGQYISSLWDGPASDGSDMTYGEATRAQSLEQLEMMYLLRQHASEYGVEITAEEEAQIKEAAAAFMAANSEETIATLAVTEEQMVDYLELQTIAIKLHDPIIADVDREVSDEQAQMSSFSYVHVAVTPDSTEEDKAAAETNAKSVLDALTEALAPAEEEEEEVKEAEAEETEAEDAEEEDVEAEDAEAEETEETEEAAEKEEPDFNEIVKAIDDSLMVAKGTFQTNLSDEWEDGTSSYLNVEMVAAVRELKEGDAPVLVTTEDDGYYVAFLNKEFDEDATKSQRNTIISTRESEKYTEVTEGWKNAAKIEVKEDVLATLLVTDAQVFTIQSTPSSATAEPEGGDIVEEEEDLTGEDEDLQPAEGEDLEPVEEEPTEKN